MPGPEAFDPNKHVCRGAPLKFSATPDGTDTAALRLPWTKTTKNKGFTASITDVDDESSALPAIRHHLATNPNVPANAPFFAFETGDNEKGWAPMTKTWFMKRCNEVWAAEGLEVLTGHCFRIGGATELLLRGVPPEVVQALGGWKSQAFLEYWRKIDSIIPNFISQSFSKASVQLVRKSMGIFRKRMAS